MTDEKKAWPRRFTAADEAAAQNLKRIWLERKKELGLTQKQAAEKLGFAGQGSFSNYLNGYIALGFHATVKIARLLGVPPEKIRPDIMQTFPEMTDSGSGALPAGRSDEDKQPAANQEPEIPSSVSRYEVKMDARFDDARERHPVEAHLENALIRIQELEEELEDSRKQKESLKRFFADQVKMNDELEKENRRLKQMIRELEEKLNVKS